MDIYEELKWRNLIKDVSDENLAKELFKKGGFKFYTGFDPTADSLTVGHLVQIIRIKMLENLGFIPYVLIGGATGLIGDPRESSERKLLDEKTALENSEAIKNQLEKYLDNKKTIFVNNYDWLKKLDLVSFLRDYGKLFNISYMLAKETIKKRLDSGISFTEFTYTILQAIDFYYLYKNYGVEVQFGGSEQWGNITSGLELIRKNMGADTKVLGLSSHLLLKSDGTKFGKSEDGALFLDKNKTTPYQLYQYFYNCSDKDLLDYFKFLTFTPKEEILEIIKKHEEAPHLRYAQEILAGSIVKFVHGEKELKIAKNITNTLFSGDIENLSEGELDTLYKSTGKLEVLKDDGILNVLTKVGLSSSNREAREFIKSGAILLNGKKVVDEKQSIKSSDTLFNKYVILKRGKKNFKMVLLK